MAALMDDHEAIELLVKGGCGVKTRMYTFIYTLLDYTIRTSSVYDPRPWQKPFIRRLFILRKVQRYWRRNRLIKAKRRCEPLKRELQAVCFSPERLWYLSLEGVIQNYETPRKSQSIKKAITFLKDLNVF